MAVPRSKLSKEQAHEIRANLWTMQEVAEQAVETLLGFERGGFVSDEAKEMTESVAADLDQMRLNLEAAIGELPEGLWVDEVAKP